MITYHKEKLSDIIEEMKPLVELHYDEVHAYKGKVALNPDWERYRVMDEQGYIHTTTCRDNGKLIGYCVFLISTNLHYQDHKYAINDVLYLDREHRGGTVAFTMLSYAETLLKECGVSVMTMHMKVHVPFEKLMEALEFKQVEKVFGKFIGE